MGRGGGDHADTEPRCEFGQRGVALVVERMPVVGQLDADPVAPEPVDQVGKGFLGRLRTAAGKGLADMAFAASGKDVPVAARRLGERVEVVARLTLFAAVQVRFGQLSLQPSVALRPTGEHQQVWPRRIGIFGAGLVAE